MMIHPCIASLSDEKRDQLFEDLYVLSMGQLNMLCRKLHVDARGKKEFLIRALKHYLLTGAQLEKEVIPEMSCAKKGESIDLSPEGLMLFGTYKNDLKTRIFLKSLIGEHFHFTAAGIDWIKERWLEGHPPTFQEFADWWQAGYKVSRPLKKEWAFLNFVKNYQDMPRHEVMRLWKGHQKNVAQRVFHLLVS